MKNRSLISIIFLGIVIFAGLLFSVYKITSKDKTYFHANGYVSISDAEASSKIYFTEGTSYKNGYNNEIIFKDDTEKKQEVSKYSFVFYQDKTISYLNDGVLMDLNDLSTDFIPYYNIKNNYLIKYTSGKYIIEGKEKNIILNNFIGKIDENKYIVAGNDLRLKLSSSEEYINNYYFELIFLEGDIVKINNQAINLETISEECYILVGDDIKIDLSKKAIFYEDTLKANLSEIVIDHDENIDIAYKEDKPSGGGGAGGGNGTGGGTGGGAGGAGGNGNGEGGTGGNGGGAEQEPIIETVVEYKNIPYVEVISSDINSRRLNLKFNVIDKHNLITGPVTVRYLNTATSEVFTKEYPVYSDTIEFFAENMMSSTRYIVTISASYIRNGNVYKDYIMFQRTFETNDIGVSLTKDFVTSDQISYKINFDKESSFQGGTLNIYDSKGNKVDSYDFTNDHQPISVTFDELKSNESYTAKIENIRYGNVTYTSGYAAMVQNKTLKYNPFKDGAIISNPIATINKIDYKFKFDLGLINDKDAIIKQVEYRIIDKTTNEVVKTIKKSDTNSIEVKIGDEIKDHTTYYFNAKITMKDNEKTVYYTTLNSNDFNMDNKLSPTVQFINGEITANTINGQFIITDPDAAVDTKKEVYVEYVNSLGDVKRQNLEYTKCEGNQSETTKCVNVNIADLISSDTYTLNLMSYVDLNDEETTPGITKIGAVKIQTQKADIIKTNLSSTMLDETDPDLLSKVFEVKVNLALGDETPEIIRDTMERFDIMLYEGVDASGAYLGAIHIDSAERDIVKDFFDETQTYTLKDFGLTLEDLQRLHITDNGQISKTYTIRLTNGKSGENYVEFRPASLTFEINEVLLGLLNNGASIAVDPILNNSELENYDKTLSEGTAIGLLITPEFNNKKYVNKINFQIYDVTDAENPSEPKEIIYDVDLEDESVIEPYEIYLNSDDADDDFLRRGRVYRVQYTLSLDLNGDGETDLVYPYELDNIDKPKPVVSEEIALKKQIPTMIVFPWTSDGTTITYKYKHEDKDGSVELVDPENKIDAKLYYKVGDSALPAEKVACPNASLDKGFVTSYTCSKLNNLNAGDKYTLMLNAQLIEREDGYEFVEISDYYFEGQITLDNISLELEKEGNLPKYNNIISIKIKNTNGANELVSALNRIAKYSATITYGNESFVISNIGKMQNYNQEVAYTVDGKAQFKATINDVAYIEETEDGETILYIDYSKIYTYEANELGSKFKALKGKDGLTVTVSAMYDTGKVGYLASTKNKYAFQIVSPGLENELPTYNYLVHYGANTFLSSPYALNAVYTYDNIQAEGFVDDRIADLYVGNEKIYFNNEFLKAGTKGYVAANLGYKITLNGVMLQDTYPIIAKELGTANINGALDFRYDEVIPTVALTSSETTINGLKFSYDIAGINASFSDIKTENDDKFIYFEVLDGDTLVKEIKVSLNEDHVQKIDLKDHKGTLKRINNTYKTDIKQLTTASGVVLDGSKYSYHYQDGSLLVSGENGTVTAVFDYVIDALDVNKTYTLKSYVKMGASGEKRYLTHGERENLYKDFEYEFTTKDVKKGIFTDSDKTFKVESLNDYATRNLISTFKVSEIIGLEKLEYEIYNADGFAVNTAQYETCKDSYNSVGGTCFTKTDKGYTASIKHDISIKDSYDFVFGTNYTIKVKATVNTTVGEIVYEEVYNTSKPVDKLKEPKVTVTKSSHVNADGSYLNFSIKIEDLDRVVSKYNLANKGQYTVWLAEGSDRTRVTEKETYNIIQNGTELIKTLKYTDLKPNTAYYLMVEYGTYTNNQGENVKREYLIPYLIYTLDDNKISVGRIDFTPITTTDPGTGSLLKFGYASNFVEEENNEDQEAYVAGINYTIRRTSGDATFNISDRKLFAPGEIEYKKNDDAENNNMGENYYQIVLSPTVYKDIANYEITFSFYLGGKITEGYTKDTCLGSNWWDENTSTCYILNTDVIYSAERQYGGAK